MAFSASAEASAIRPTCCKGLGLGDLVSGVAGIEADRFDGRSHGLARAGPARSGPGSAAIGPGHCPAGSLIACSASCRLNSGRMSMFVSARSTKGSAVIGSRTICVTFLRALLGSVAGFERKEHSALRIRLPEDLAQLVGNQHRLDLGEFQLLGDLRGREAAFEADHQRRDLARPHRPLPLAEMDRRNTTASVRRRACAIAWACPRPSPRRRRVLTPGVMLWKLVTSISTGPKFFESGTGTNGAPPTWGSPAAEAAGGGESSGFGSSGGADSDGSGRAAGVGTAVSVVAAASAGIALPSAKRTAAGRDCVAAGWLPM